MSLFNLLTPLDYAIFGALISIFGVGCYTIVAKLCEWLR